MARIILCMAGALIPGVHNIQKAVLFTVDPNLHQIQIVTGSGPLDPEFPTGGTVKDRHIPSQGFIEGIPVGKTGNQDRTGFLVLGHGHQ